MKAGRFLGVVVMGMALLLASCALKPAWDLVGKWQKTDGNETLEFSRTGTVTVVSGSTTFTVPYKMSDTKHIQIDLGSLGSLTTEMSVSGDTLTLTAPGGKKMTFTKAKEAAPQAQASAPQAKPQTGTHDQGHAPAQSHK